MIKYIFTIIFILTSLFKLNSQEDLQYVEYFYKSGSISSKGYLRNNRPDGYWITYYENGQIKSEGNRKNFELEGLWKFYDQAGKIILEVNYCSGKKCGNRITYNEDEVIEENFEEDIKQGYTYVYYPDGKIKEKKYYKNGLEEGPAYIFNRDGIVITICHYKKGYLVSKEFINRYNAIGNKDGVWVEFYEEGGFKTYQEWKNGVLNGYFKTYDRNGDLLKVEFYKDGQLVPESKEIKTLEIKYDYYDNGKIKVAGSYFKGIPEGIRREYDQQGKITKSYFFINGIVILEGIIDEKGLKQGDFKEYYENGQLRAEGKYKDSKPVGTWKFFYPNGNLYQIGEYDTKGRKTDKWLTYYDNGQIQKEEYYEKNLQEGDYIEYDINGNIIVNGKFLDGEETGKWIYKIGDIIEEKDYIEGKEHGKWKIFDKETKRLIYEGNYLDAYPNGKHVYYWPNGTIRIEGYYIMGLKEGEWNYYDENGQHIVSVIYKNGVEKKYNRTTLFPPTE